MSIVALVLLMAGTTAAEDAGYQRALPGYNYSFPRDHGSHPAFRTEWWYFTGNLDGDDGRPFGFELTVFRVRTIPDGDPLPAASPLVAEQVFLGHFAISDVRGRRLASWERIGRPGLGQAHGAEERLDVRLTDWSIEMPSPDLIRLRAAAEGTSLSLELRPLKPHVIHGENGVHQKADDPGQASHYISFTRLEASGALRWEGRDHAVGGLAWMDHEFGSDQLGPGEIGWDWFALQLDSGEDLMLYQLRRRDGTANPFSRGSIVGADGSAEPIVSTEYTIEATGRWRSPHSGAEYPMGWVVTIPSRRARLVVTPRFEDQELQTERLTGTVYWEGAVTIEGMWEGRPAAGRGYVELTGYAEGVAK